VPRSAIDLAVQRHIWRRWGRIIKEAAVAQGYNARELGAELGAARATVHAWWMGHRAPSISHRRALCELLSIRPDSLDADRDSCPYCGHLYR
jgi:transcriptional regulator with XRE-family HTH domain